MDKLIYMSVHLVCLVYILYKVWGWKRKVYEICILLYGKKSEKNFVNEKPFDSSVPIDETDVIGHTRFVFLDENVGETVSPYMSQPLDMESDYIGGEEDTPEEEVECSLPLEEMRMLKEEQEELDAISPETDVVSQAVTPDDLDNAGDVLFKLNDADKDEEKSLRAAITLYTIRNTDLYDVFSSQMENKEVIEKLFGKYLDGNSIPFPLKDNKRKQSQHNWRNLF